MLVLVCFTLALTSVVQAQLTRTWVLGTGGDDANPCSLPAPCKTFAGALPKTAVNGEISAMGPGGYGTVTINKAITINGEGTLAGIINSGTSGINVNVTTNPATAVVIIRNISINGANTGTDGIVFRAGGTLQVDHCWIYNQLGDAIDASGLVTAGNLKVNDTIIEDVNGDGIRMSTTTGQLVAWIDDTQVQDVGLDGIEAVDNVRAAIRNVVVTHTTGSSNAGIEISGTNSFFNIDDVLVSYFSVGMQSSRGSEIRVSDSIIAQNVTGVSAHGGTMVSYQGNSLMGNPTPGAFTSTINKQ